MSNKNQKEALKILEKELEAVGVIQVDVPTNYGKELKYRWRHILSEVEVKHNKSRNCNIPAHKIARKDLAQIRAEFRKQRVYI